MHPERSVTGLWYIVTMSTRVMEKSFPGVLVIYDWDNSTKQNKILEIRRSFINPYFNPRSGFPSPKKSQQDYTILHIFG